MKDPNNWCLCKSQATNDSILVSYSLATSDVVYSINGGPENQVPADILAGFRSPNDKSLFGYTARQLLYRHIAQCEASDVEELTLP